MAPRLEQIKQFYRDFAAADLERLGRIYHPEVVFTDPLVCVRGLPDLRRHFAAMRAGARECRFVFDGEIVGGDAAALFWRMTAAAARLNRGRAFETAGASHLRFAGDGLIVGHRDYFDLGEMVYEKIPIFGAVTRALRRRLGGG